MILRATLRSFTQQPGFFIVAVTTLALGIAGATSIFSVIESVLLRPLPYGEPDRLVMVWGTDSDSTEGNVSGANLIDWQDRRTRRPADGAPLRLTSVGGAHPLDGNGERPL